MSGWIGVDLDGTLAHHDGWVGPDHIGKPIPLMVARVKRWIQQGREVRIFTARVGATAGFVEGSSLVDTPDFAQHQVKLIQDWCEQHIGVRLPVTARKDYGMIELWDDRCVRVERNTGRKL